VFIDGAQVPGATPLTVSLADDEFHEVRVEKAGYEIGRRALKPEDREPSVTLKLEAEKEPRGRLMVDSNDSGEVFVDGQDTGFQAPTIPMRLSAGEHSVDLRDHAGHRSVTTRVTVRQGETERVSLRYPEPAK
jgi:hypothetical protein